MPSVVVWGAPCSGKSTYIRERAKYGDIVLDLDRIALAFMPEGSPHHDYPDHIRECARKARLAVVDDAARWGLHGPETAWIIDSNATDAGRNRWRAMGCEVVELHVDPETCHARADAERPAHVHAIIDGWFARHGTPARSSSH